MQNPTIRIALLMPTYSDIPPAVYKTHLAAAIIAQKRGYSIEQVGVTEKELLRSSRNRLFEAFLSTDCTHALCLDSDIVLPPYAIVDLIEAKYPAITGIYFQKYPPYWPVIMREEESSKFKRKKIYKWITQWPENTIFSIDACGFGCILLERKVIEQISPPWFTQPGEEGEDIEFCSKIKKAGIQLMCHSEVICGHVTNRIIIIDIAKEKKEEVNNDNIR